MDWAKFWESVQWTTLIGTGVAAYAGSAAAFHVTKKQALRERTRLEVEECNRALIKLAKQLQFAVTHRDDQIEAHRGHSFRHLIVTAHHEVSPTHLRVNLAALSFLIQAEGAGLLQDIARADESYHELVVVLNSRTKFHIDLQRACAAAKLDTRIVDPDRVLDAAGPMLWDALKWGTDQVYERSDEAIAALTEIGAKASPLLKKIYPTAKFFEFTPNA